MAYCCRSIAVDYIHPSKREERLSCCVYDLMML